MDHCFQEIPGSYHSQNQIELHQCFVAPFAPSPIARQSPLSIAAPSKHQFRRSDCTSSVGVQSTVRPARVRGTDRTNSSPSSLCRSSSLFVERSSGFKL
ncbi:hypothetical protein Q3G72_023187 [Acer saccharum]|nr:hypothetical protein Q3G72_023187 [Acer saccharum]